MGGSASISLCRVYKSSIHRDGSLATLCKSDGIYITHITQNGGKMPTVTQRVTQALRSGQIDETSRLSDVHGIGAYLEGRLQFAFRIAQPPMTVGDLWRSTRRRGTDGIVKTLYRALQNERANECVSATSLGRRRYHTGDINQMGYEAVVALLDHQRRGRRVTYGTIPTRLPTRSPSSKTCGCTVVHQCNGPTCRLSDDGRTCVPRAHNSRGFVGVVAHTNQRETEGDTQHRASRIRMTNALRRDPDSMRDWNAGKARRLSYSRRGRSVWRRPGSRVRHNR